MTWRMNTVDHRLQELSRINDQGMYKYQRGGKDQVMVKNQVPWPQSHVLAGTSKARITYDSLSTFQWMSGFRVIIREESDVKIKNAMLDYVTDLIQDAQDFGWPSIKGAHALILCHMEEGKFNRLMSEKLDRLRRAHAKKIMTNPSTSQTACGKVDSQGMVCRYFQTAVLQCLKVNSPLNFIMVTSVLLLKVQGLVPLSNAGFCIEYRELSCAKVLKLAIKNHRVNSTTYCNSFQSTSVKPVIKPRVHKFYNKVLPHPALPSVVHPPVIKTKGCQRVIKNQKGK